MWFREQDDIPADVEAVLKASALLSVNEFQIFRLAFASWHGYEADEETIEASFIPYMFAERVPWWVRSFTRAVLRLDREGTLDPAQFGIRRRYANERDQRRGQLYLIGLASALFILIYLAERTAQWLHLTDCIFPPCY